MRTGVIVALIACAGCVPGSQDFVVVDPGDGGATVRDAATAGDGGTGARGAVLASVARCEDALSAILGQAEFDGDTGDFTLFPVSGGASLEEGHLVLPSPETWLLSRDMFVLGDTAACAEVELTFAEVEDGSGFLFGLRGTEHGTLLRLSPAGQALQLTTFEPASTRVDAAALAVPTGGATARFVVFSFVGEGYAHAEARRLDDGSVAAAHGPYGGAAEPLAVELTLFAPDVARARVDRLAVGRLTPEARARLDTWSE